MHVVHAILIAVVIFAVLWALGVILAYIIPALLFIGLVTIVYGVLKASKNGPIA